MGCLLPPRRGFSPDSPVLLPPQKTSLNSNSKRIVGMFVLNRAMSGLVLTPASTRLHRATRVIVTLARLDDSPSKVILTGTAEKPLIG